MTSWNDRLNADPMPWLLADDSPAVKALALRWLDDRTEDDPEVRQAREDACVSGPIAAILDAQHPDGYWAKPGPGYGPKYIGSAWQIIFLDQMGADDQNERVRKGCDYLLSRCVTSNGGFGCSSNEKTMAPPPSAVIHCLNGNLLRAFIGFGYLEDERVQGAIEWQARAITGDGFTTYYRSGTSGPNFCCAANEWLPCAWGAVKTMLGLARVPESGRTAEVREALRQGAEFLLSRDPAVADYPFGSRASRPNASWFKPGFPSGYVTDVLQNLEALCELGYARDPRLKSAIAWLLSLQDDQGRWKNQYSYHGKLWEDIEKQGQPSKWVTLRACRVLKQALDVES